MGLNSALESIRMFLNIELSATVAANAAAYLQQKQEQDLEKHFAHLMHRFHAATKLEMVTIVDTPDIDSEHLLQSLLGKSTLATDPLQIVMLHQLESQKEAIRKNDMEITKVLKWVQEYEPIFKAQEEAVAARKQKPGDPNKGLDMSKKTDQDPSEAPPAKPSSAPWANKSINLNTKIHTFLTGIAISNKDIAKDKFHEIEELLARSSGSPSETAIAAAIEGVLRDFDEKLEAARLHADVKYDPDQDEETHEGDEVEEDSQGQEDPNKGPQQIDRRAEEGPQQVDRRASEAQKRASVLAEKQEAEAAEARKKAEAKRINSIALRFSREKLWSFEFHSVTTLKLFSFSKEQIAKARESEHVRRAEEQVTAAHQKIAESLEGIIEGCRIHYKKEKAATAVALAAAATQKEVSDKLQQQAYELDQRIQLEKEDPTVRPTIFVRGDVCAFVSVSWRNFVFYHFHVGVCARERKGILHHILETGAILELLEPKPSCLVLRRLKYVRNP